MHDLTAYVGSDQVVVSRRFVIIQPANGWWMIAPKLEGEVEWRGRCVDLSKAYKQIPVSPESRYFAELMVHRYGTGSLVYFVGDSLPFGASSSVFGFNRVSRSLWHIASVFCKRLGESF